MSKNQTLDLIEKRISEHKLEAAGSELNTQQLQKQAKENHRPNLQTLQKLAILKDKALFHKAAVMVLEELKEELTKQGTTQKD